MIADPPLYSAAQAGFIVLTAVYFGLFFREIAKGARRSSLPPAGRMRLMAVMIVTLVAWTAFVSAWSLSGKMSDFSLFPFNIIPVILIPVILLVALLNSRAFGEVLKHIPTAHIIRLQSFRIVVEILLWVLFISNLLPVQMTFEGMNLDILAGLTAPLVAFLAGRGKLSAKGMVIWNIVGLGLLLNIVAIAILSTPSPWRVFMNDPANYIVTHFPVSLLPGLLVPLAYYLHFISLKQLAGKKPTPDSRSGSAP